MRRQRIIEITLLTLFLNTVCFAQQTVDQIVDNRINEKNIPGFAFIISKNGEIVEEGYRGLSNVELGTPVTEKSVFAIASMSKTFTAAATLLLTEAGLLSLDDKVKTYIPEAPESWNSITIKHLMTHSSGLVDDWELYSWDESNEFFLRTQNDSLFLKHLFDRELIFEPGTSVRYSCGPFVLGVVIERITGKFYGDYLQEFIFEPLSLNETRVDHPYQLIPNRVSGYFNYDSTEMNTGISGMGNGILISPISYGRADVGIRTTARDLMAFYSALLNGTLLNDKSTQLMFNPATLDNGDLVSTAPGWMNWPLMGNLVLEHSGGFRTGFSSQGFVIPKDKFVIIILTNMSGGSSFPLVQEIASTYYPELSQLSKRDSVRDNSSDLTGKHLTLFRNLVSGELSKKVVNENFPKSYMSSRLKASISSTKSLVYLGEDDVSTREIIFFDIRIHTLRYYKLIGDSTLYTTVSLDKDDKVVFIDYPETE